MKIDIVSKAVTAWLAMRSAMFTVFVAVSGVTALSAEHGVPTVLTEDRRTLWNPGLMVEGGIPARTKLCATVNASDFGNGTVDAAFAIQKALDRCPAGQVVQLSAGTFLANDYVIIWKAITLRGAGAGKTVLQRTNGAKINQEIVPESRPNIIIGPNRWPKSDVYASQNLVVDAAKGAYSITIANAAGFRKGQFVLLDEESGASWQPDRLGRGQIWASPDYRVVWRLHKPPHPSDDGLEAKSPTGGSAAGWFSRQGRPTNEMKEIASVEGNVITFTSPLHIEYRVANAAQLIRHTADHLFTTHGGVEDLTVIGGSDGGIVFTDTAYAWAKGVEVTVWSGNGISVARSFRVEVRDSYIHEAAWAQPGGAGYAISLSNASAEVLFENNIITKANKVMVVRSSGAGSVFGYNYVDAGYINTIDRWIEVGLNASHMVGSHHVLFEGNYGFNWDSDKTHGNSIYHTIYRNHLRCIRMPFTNPLNGKTIDDAHDARSGPKRCAGATAYSYWMSFIGNVLGAEGQMAGFTYDVTGPGGMRKPAIWLLGWDDSSPQPYDPFTATTTVRYGNFDFLTNQVHWGVGAEERPLPDSLYLKEKPAFFKAGRGYIWPWVNPTGSTKLYTLPAKARLDAGTPFVQP